jgi:hypothetical protein
MLSNGIFLFRHNNEVYHIRIYTQEVDGSIKHYLVDGLLFDSLQVISTTIVELENIDNSCWFLDIDSILSYAFAWRSFSSC